MVKVAQGIGRKFKLFMIVLLLGLLVLSYFFFFYTKKCTAQDCFLDALGKCKRATFTSEQEKAKWLYSIKGMSRDGCKVYVEAAEIKTAESKALEGKFMFCYLPIKTVIMPEEKIEYCHGLLKEAIQDQIIERMHLYIVENIGEVRKPFEEF